LRRSSVAILQVEMPESIGCSLTLDDDIIVGISHFDPRFGENGCAVVVAQLAN
jgi:hypothetical protein